METMLRKLTATVEGINAHGMNPHTTVQKTIYRTYNNKNQSKYYCKKSRSFTK